MRDINQIIIHCSATRHTDAHLDREFIRQLHVEDRGWSDIGYHWIITRAGVIQKGRPLHRAGAHAKGFNRHSIGICLMGGLADNGLPAEGLHYFSLDQQLSLTWLIENTKRFFPEIADVVGHRDLSPDVNGDGIVTPDEWLKQCPTFDVKTFLLSVPTTIAKLEFSGWEPVIVQ